MKNRLKINSLLNLVISCIIFILEIMPDSVKIVSLTEPNNVSEVEYVSYLMEPNMLLQGIAFLTYFIALSTIFIIIFNAVNFYKENNKLTIMTLVGNSLCLIGSVILIALKREYVTIHNVIIMVMYLALIIITAINLRLSLLPKKTFDSREE